MKIIEDYGEYGIFEFKDDMINGEYRVRITTPSTLNTLKSLEKNSMTQYLTNIATLASMDPEIIKSLDIKSLKQLMDMTY